MEKILDLNNCTIGQLKEFIKNIPDDVNINIESCGTTGFVEKYNIELQEYEAEVNPDVYFNIYAESGSFNKITIKFEEFIKYLILRRESYVSNYYFISKWYRIGSN